MLNKFNIKTISLDQLLIDVYNQEQKEINEKKKKNKKGFLLNI